ncbi:transcriptional regulator, LacI family [Noviherbaspirillum humi]|uniref:Transcriptional regulator, LacI family n=1 Tax=Noviherbaspirillum humi TaxID=1688639 RepID=A0A239FMY1_9BURK|nr:LacI family DNA-binding transcriptional regulator [Noviherbaspirillum humi]SNS57978.1 transcriptional regulator, LacI family [Noviherbaspirillum humi]
MTTRRSKTSARKVAEDQPITLVRPEARVDAVTLKDVAKVAGVSPMTVSRALNRPEIVRADTVALVQKAVKLTGYIPNQLAGALTGGRTRLVAAIVPHISNSIFVETVQALSDRLWQDGYQLLLGLSGYPASREDDLITAILSRRPDGIVLTGIGHSQDTRIKILSTGIPVVEIWDLTPTPLDMVIGFSHVRIGEAIAHDLLKRGYRRYGLLCADDERSLIRQQSIADTLKQQGISAIHAQVGRAPSTFQLGREGLARLLDEGNRFDVLVCGSDAIAQGALAEAQARAMRVPKDLAVMGFGDFDFSAHTHPSLSTVRIEKKAIGIQAAEALLARAVGRALERKVIDVGFELVARAST